MSVWTQERIDRARKALLAGASPTDVAREFGTSRGRLKQHLLKASASLPVPWAPTAEDFRRLEAAYMTLMGQGVPEAEVAERLNLTPTTRATFKGYYLAQKSGVSRDSSCPAFADHELHVSAVMAEGGFPVATGGRWIGPDGEPWRPRADGV